MAAQATTFATLTINAVGAKNPSVLGQAATVPVRILVRNVGGALIFISTSTDDLSGKNGPSAGCYRLPQDTSDVFVLQPKQILLALAIGAGAQASVSVSEAIPQTFGG